MESQNHVSCIIMCFKNEEEASWRARYLRLSLGKIVKPMVHNFETSS